MPLTDVKIRQAKPAGRPVKLTDSNGLYIEVKPNGSKLWRYRYRIDGKENVFAIGEYPQVSLLDARKARDDARDLVKQGTHPAHARQAEKLGNIVENANTFEAVTREYIEQKRRTWTQLYGDRFERFFEVNVFPQIGKQPVRKVTAAMILAMLRKVEKRGAVTLAIQIRQWCSAVFRYAVATGRADSDPAAALKGAIHRPTVENSRPMSEEEIRDYLVRLDGFSGYRTTAIALRLILLTFTRTVELRTAEWSEINLDAAEWAIPAPKMKMRRKHVVPLSRQSIELLTELHRITGNGRYLFPNTRRPDDVMSATTLNRALEYLGYDSGTVTAHDFRATASTHLHEQGYNSDHIELQLAHAENDRTRAAYNHAKHLPERRVMMQEWADWIDALKKKEE